MSKGIDVRIESLRAKLESDLWTFNDVSFYGRIFRIPDAEGNITPMRFIYPQDYEDVLTNDTKDGVVFFDVQPDESFEGSSFQSEVWICFAIDLDKLYPSVKSERATEYAHEDVLKIVKRKWGNNSITGLVRGITAFSDYSGVKFTDDDQPFYIFRLNTEIKYPINC